MRYADSPNRPKVESQRAESIATEVLGQCFELTEAHGPNGPWFIESVTIRRFGDTIMLYDGDGQLGNSFEVSHFTENNLGDSPLEGLLFEVEMVNKKWREAL